MSTEINPTSPALLEGALELIARATELASDYEEDLQTVVREAATATVTDEQKRSLFTRIIEALHNGGVEVSGEDRRRIAAEVRAEVDALLPQRTDRTDAALGEAPSRITLVERNDHVPVTVKPIPIFKGRAVPMMEGFVDITTIHLWKDNHRVELWVQEFRDREGREPEDHEVLAILQGDMVSTGQKADPFEIAPLAKSIAERGVVIPPILTWDGKPWDGNRRIAAAKYVLTKKGFTEQERERARWVKVWVANDTTKDVIDDIVVAMNFEPNYRQPWREYIKARQVEKRFRDAEERHTLAGDRITQALHKRLREEVAEHYAIDAQRVSRYLEMVKWANDFEAYHTDERGLDANQVRYKTNEIFEYFFELQAGKGLAAKLTTKLDQDDDLKVIVYDLMYDVIESGAQVRALRTVVVDEPSLRILTRAHEESHTDVDSARRSIVEAIAEAAKNSPTKKTGFAQFVKSMVDRLGSAPPKQWEAVDTQTLRELRKVMPGALGAIDGELTDRDLTVQVAAERD